MRDYESIAIALTAAETGHLVFSTLHTNSAAQTVDRIIDIFFTLALYVTPLMIVIAGLLFVTAAGNPNQVQTAKNILLYSLIGFLIILVAKGIVELFIEVLTK